MGIRRAKLGRSGMLVAEVTQSQDLLGSLRELGAARFVVEGARQPSSDQDVSGRTDVVREERDEA